MVQLARAAVPVVSIIYIHMLLYFVNLIVSWSCRLCWFGSVGARSRFPDACSVFCALAFTAPDYVSIIFQ